MAVDNTETTDQGTNQGNPGEGEGDNQSVDNKTDANDQNQAADQQDDGQQKVDGDKKGEEDKKTSLLDGEKDDGEKKPDEEKSQAPEKYDEFTLPQGFTMNELALEAFMPAAKDAELSQENAQKMVDLFAKLQQSEADKFAKEFYDKMDANIAAVKTDSVIGGDKYDASINTINKLVGKFGGQEVYDVLKETGIGTSLPFLKMMAKIGDVLGEDVLIDETSGGGVGGVGSPNKTFGERLYPNMKT